MDSRRIKEDLKERASEVIDSPPDGGLQITAPSSNNSNFKSSLTIFILGGFFGVLLTVIVLSILGTLPSILEAVISAIIGGFITLIFNNTKNNK